ncbi:uncharacterized protein LOC142977414 isoform X2 [Anticarsia gemmatalis]|uniref:uncharacterized protein LOC142977414 isoform X2 n=1 Tax=Anticarsia gemmatalis TaxID=129554 RepID=UPI003F759F86
METAAQSPVAVASSSNTCNGTQNKTEKWNKNNLDHSLNKSSNNSTNRPVSATTGCNMSVMSPTHRPKSSPVHPLRPESDTSRSSEETRSGSTSGEGSRNSTPRRRKNDQHQSPKKQGQYKHGQQEQPESSPGRIIVTGYPNYTTPLDLKELFSQFGSVRIDKCNSWSASLTFTPPAAARAALAAPRLHVYGHFLSARPYSCRRDEPPHDYRRDFSKTKQKNMIIAPTMIDLSGEFHEQVERILATIRLSQEDIQKISLLYKDLENAFQSIWPGCQAVPFGSITTGLGIKTSDADCFLSLPAKFRTPGQLASHVGRARRVLVAYPHTFTEILAIPRANTPIVKFYHVPTDTNCDLTFKTPLGAQNSRLVAFLLHSDPRLTPVAVVVKYWAKVHELSGTGKLTNYALTLLILFYFQQRPHAILPPVRWLQRDHEHDHFVDYWNTGFLNDPKLLPTVADESSIAELLGGFFEFYSKFNFEELVVCPYLGEPVKKEAFGDTTALPDEFSIYKNNILCNHVMPIRFQTSFCVQDPFEQCHNVASTVTSKLAMDIRTYFQFAATAYENDKENGCIDFLRYILLDKPKLIRGRQHLEYRVNFFPRVVCSIIKEDWQSVIRDVVFNVFENIMKIKLEKLEESLSEDGKPREKYGADITKPVWRRKKYNFLFSTEMLGVEGKQTKITEEIMSKEQTVGLRIHLILLFSDDPRSAVASVRMAGGDLDAFRHMGKFFIGVMQGWMIHFLKEHSMPYTPSPDNDTGEAEGADGADGSVEDKSKDDDSDVSNSPCTTPPQEKDTVDDPPPSPPPPQGPGAPHSARDAGDERTPREPDE